MRVSKQNLHILFYYIGIYGLIYGGSYTISHFGISEALSRNVIAVISINSLILVIALFLAYSFSQRSDIKFSHVLGIKKEGLFGSLIFSGAILGFLSLVTLIALKLIGGIHSTDEFLKIIITKVSTYSGTPWFNYANPTMLPFVALVVWTISGVLFFALMIAYPYEIINNPRYLPIISLLFVFLYNNPLITGEWKPDDIIVLGILFPLIYHLTRNSIGLILSYVFLFEFPILVAFLKGWGITAFLILFVGRILWEIFCMIVVMIRFVKFKSQVTELTS